MKSLFCLTVPAESVRRAGEGWVAGAAVWSHGTRSEEAESRGCWCSVLSLAFGPAVMVDFPICRKVSLGAKDAIDATAHGQSESKVARQHLLALSRAPLRLGSKHTEQEMCWISVLEGTVVLRKRRNWGKGSLVLAHRVLSMSQDFCVNKVFQGGGDYVATLRRFHSHN